MNRVSIAYNPYTTSTVLTVNGATPPAGANFAKVCEGTRLLIWIDKFLQLFYDKYRDKNVMVDFSGTPQDAADVERAIKEFNQKENCHFKLDKVVESVTSKPLEQLRKLYEEGKNGPYANVFNSDVMKKAFNHAVDPDFEVNVIATMSSGKSTLINALLGQRLMPSKNEACTATISKVYDYDGQPFTAVRYNKDNQLLTKHPEPVTLKLMKSWNDAPETSIIEIKGDIPTIDETGDSRYVFVDTPGPNNARNQAHKERTFDTIHNDLLSMILYVMNATQFGINDDVDLLNSVQKAMNDGGRQAQDRFIFVANKMDEMKVNEDDDIGASLDRIRKDLQERGIKNPIVIPISARLALLLRLKKYCPEQFDEDMAEELSKLLKYFLKYPEMNMYQYCKESLGSNIVRNLDERLARAESDEDKAIIYSGVPVLEELLKDFLFRYAIPAKVKSAVDRFICTLRDAKEHVEMLNMLKQTDEKLHTTALALGNKDAKKRQLEEGERFKKEIREMGYGISASTKEKITGLRGEEEDVIAGIDRLFSENKVSVFEAKDLAKRAEKRCHNFAADAIAVLKKALKVECVDELERLKERYQEFITKILKERFPADEAARDLQASVFAVPSTSDLIDKNTSTETVCVGSHEERLWYTLWIFKKTVKDYEEREYVDLKPMKDEFCASIRFFTNSNIHNFEKQARNEVESIKENLLKAMSSMEKRMEELEKEICHLADDRQGAEKKKAELEASVQWYNSCLSKLKKIIS